MCRIRPENKLEKEGNYVKCVTYDSTNISVNVNSNLQRFLKNIFETLFLSFK